MKRIKISKNDIKILELMMNRSKTKLSNKILCYILITIQNSHNYHELHKNDWDYSLREEDLKIRKVDIQCKFENYNRKTIFNAFKELEDENIIIIKESNIRGRHIPAADEIDINWDIFA